MTNFDYDVLIVGSGFGGSVAALRAAEKGYRVGVRESGKRWNDADIPKSQWHLPGFLWRTRFTCRPNSFRRTGVGEHHGRGVLRKSGSRGGRPVLRWGRTASYRVHLVREVQYRLSSAPASTNCTRSTTWSLSREVGSRSTRAIRGGLNEPRTRGITSTRPSR
ncbi:FAD-binding protein [Kribbella sp. NPDC026596]|uniref:FAD-binding protein n=1 Tax=Kribbella sp. NPDC026596 TaxID=3155122 RepID=UPI0033EFB7CE